jgi:chromate transport protein ChrA
MIELVHLMAFWSYWTGPWDLGLISLWLFCLPFILLISLVAWVIEKFKDK